MIWATDRTFQNRPVVKWRPCNEGKRNGGDVERAKVEWNNCGTISLNTTERCEMCGCRDQLESKQHLVGLLCKIFPWTNCQHLIFYLFYLLKHLLSAQFQLLESEAVFYLAFHLGLHWVAICRPIAHFKTNKHETAANCNRLHFILLFLLCWLDRTN